MSHKSYLLFLILSHASRDYLTVHGNLRCPRTSLEVFAAVVKTTFSLDGAYYSPVVAAVTTMHTCRPDS